MSQEAKILSAIGALTLVVVIGAAFMFGGSTSPTQPAKKEVLAASIQKDVLTHSDSYTIAAKNAKVTLVEFGDFECPACGLMYPVVKQILENYKGKITYVFREFPLPGHKNGASAAEAAEAAGAQGKFFEMVDKLYTNQTQWGEGDKAKDYYIKFAQELGLNMDKFNKDINSNAYQKRIQRDQNDGNSIGIDATPTFFINGEKITGGLPYNDFKAKIDSYLR